ncbi:SdpA family antimicrobial peptide system protein [Oceanobacillus piezotolerans]|uniref:SdpA family antimicrobial peptide system protein n=1 Tax=Oceanobacillus piezotolerans TaxID=2448030 RepID=A0A498DCV1_9BACI|nr:SdpA family antimicrobial peptide system protein [Oceanobacillus piezotolerans]RLL39809.1 SdpA family antimicrobial peptide system protein [Oceanobacillus piezotolerans]
MRKIKLSIFMMIVFWGTFFFITIISSLSYSPFALSKSTTSTINSHVLQSWGFFSKNPRDQLFNVHVLEDSNKTIVWPNNLPRNAFGLIRTGRAQGIEAGALFSQIDSEQRDTCDGDIKNCLKDLNVSQKIINQDKNPSLCGNIGFSFQEPVPWAWGKYYSQNDMEAEVIKVEVQCKYG